MPKMATPRDRLLVVSLQQIVVDRWPGEFLTYGEKETQYGPIFGHAVYFPGFRESQ